MTSQVIPAAAANHWLVFRDEAGWGCTGCDWTGKLDDFWQTHERRTDELPF